MKRKHNLILDTLSFVYVYVLRK